MNILATLFLHRGGVPSRQSVLAARWPWIPGAGRRSQQSIAPPAQARVRLPHSSAAPPTGFRWSSRMAIRFTDSTGMRSRSAGRPKTASGGAIDLDGFFGCTGDESADGSTNRPSWR